MQANMALLPEAKEGLRESAPVQFLVIDLHPSNLVWVNDGNMTRVYSVHFSH